MTPLDILAIIVGPFVGGAPTAPDLVLTAFYMLLTLLPTYAVYSFIRGIILRPQKSNDNIQVDEKVFRILLLTVILPLYFLLFVLLISLLPLKPLLFIDNPSMVTTLSMLVNEYGKDIILALFASTIVSILLVFWSLSALGFVRDLLYLKKLINVFIQGSLALVFVFSMLYFYNFSIISASLLFMPNLKGYFVFFFLQAVVMLVLLGISTRYTTNIAQLISNKIIELAGKIGRFLKLNTMSVSIILAFLSLIFSIYVAYSATTQSITTDLSSYLSIARVKDTNNLLVFVPENSTIWLIVFNGHNKTILDAELRYGSKQLVTSCETAKRASFWIFTLRGWIEVPSINERIKKYCTPDASNIKQASKTPPNRP